MAENFEPNNDGAFAFFLSSEKIKAKQMAKKNKKRFDKVGFFAKCQKKWQVCPNNL